MRTWFLAASLVTACSSGGSGGGGATCDASNCADIAQVITANGGTPSACVEPTPKFESACQAYESCLKQCGQ